MKIGNVRRAARKSKCSFELVDGWPLAGPLEKTLKIETRYITISFLSLQLNKIYDRNKSLFMNQNPEI